MDLKRFILDWEDRLVGKIFVSQTQSLIPRIHVKMPGLVVEGCNLSSGVVETGLVGQVVQRNL